VTENTQTLAKVTDVTQIVSSLVMLAASTVIVISYATDAISFELAVVVLLGVIALSVSEVEH
jgi:hypothetical protein